MLHIFFWFSVTNTFQEHHYLSCLSWINIHKSLWNHRKRDVIYNLPNNCEVFKGFQYEKQLLFLVYSSVHNKQELKMPFFKIRNVTLKVKSWHKSSPTHQAGPFSHVTTPLTPYFLCFHYLHITFTMEPSIWHWCIKKCSNLVHKYKHT